MNDDAEREPFKLGDEVTLRPVSRLPPPVSSLMFGTVEDIRDGTIIVRWNGGLRGRFVAARLIRWASRPVPVLVVEEGDYE